ncbi:hypothetical protein CAPN008_13510 [Capnocytophaga canis]|uniref:hypothetical protein n=1 Tax=Capnocytophaga canis TaxID=1848903 RepID=UPI001ACD2E70|nr:hypothetical protein [Capnocytophaga canis]GIM61301.1 hypothetical protein CAPN008_13510 [Capnocytophaga canis]
MESEKYFKNLSNKELDSLYAVLVRHPESAENMRQAKEIEKIMLDRYETYHNIKIGFKNNNKLKPTELNPKNT